MQITFFMYIPTSCHDTIFINPDNLLKIRDFHLHIYPLIGPKCRLPTRTSTNSELAEMMAESFFPYY
jgi:hypothetical protein